MKQLDVDVSPPASIITLRMVRVLICVLSALAGICLQITLLIDLRAKCSEIMFFDLVTLNFDL